MPRGSSPNRLVVAELPQPGLPQPADARLVDASGPIREARLPAASRQNKQADRAERIWSLGLRYVRLPNSGCNAQRLNAEEGRIFPGSFEMFRRAASLSSRTWPTLKTGGVRQLPREI